MIFPSLEVVGRRVIRDGSVTAVNAGRDLTLPLFPPAGLMDKAPVDAKPSP
jgi:hypothetical protein